MHRGVFVIILLVVISILLNCGEWLVKEPNDSGPGKETARQLLSAVQAKMFINFNSHTDRILCMWMQQLASNSRSYVMDGYHQKNNFDEEFDSWYTGGGLLDIRKVQEIAERENDMRLAGIAQVLEAYTMGTVTAIWGDIPYSEAANDEIRYPLYDDQKQVYNAIQVLLDEAIVNLESSGSDSSTEPVELNYSGNPQKWIGLAYTLKARLYLHWAKTDKAKYLAWAKEAAQKGISSIQDNFKAVYENSPDSENLFYQFQIERSGYMVAGHYLVNLLMERNDPRLYLYYSKDADDSYSGSRPGDHNYGVSNINPDSYGSPSWDLNLVSFEENQFILAECHYKLDGNEEAARMAVQTAIDAIWDYYEFSPASEKPDLSGLTGEDLFREIMIQKYIAQFLNFEIYNDWKRTGYPDDLVVGSEYYYSGGIPRRLYYGGRETTYNPNAPSLESQPSRNDNDPDVIY